VTRDELLRSLEAVLERPASARELLQALKIPRDARATFRRQLRALTLDGSLVLIRGRRYALPGRGEVAVGVLAVHPDGYGFVAAGRAGEPDLYVPRDHLKDALHGDRVAVRSVRSRRRDGSEARVIRVVERGRARLLGEFRAGSGGRADVRPLDPRWPQRVLVAPGDTRGAVGGDVVEVEIIEWPTATRGPVGRVTEVLGPIDAPGVDTRVVVRAHGIVEAHGEAAARDAARIGHTPRPEDLEGRTDFRGRDIVTIDQEGARDFDDAVSVERLPGGRFRLGVHIADVAHYVRPGTPLDEDARARGTSVYFPERAIHMFPEPLATGVCSLVEGADRLVQSCLMDVDGRGVVQRCEFHDGVIRSRARLTYTEVDAILTARDPEARARRQALVPMLEDLRDLFSVLRERRRRRGSIDFDLPESEIVLDDDGRVAAITASERNVAHRLIEEFMVLANETVAGELERRGVPSLFRVHEPPDPVKVEAFEAFAATLGQSLGVRGRAPGPGDFQRLLDRVAGSPIERPVAFLMLRTMQQARYDARNLGHFGLASEAYTHFTSPIRRYPDLVVHRLLRESRRGGLTDERRAGLDAELPEVARHASDCERRATEAERELVRWKKVRFMADKVGEEFDGYVTGVAAFGLFVELVVPFVEGLVHVSTMGSDDYRYVESAHAWHGARTRAIFRLGDRVRVRVLKVDTDRRLLDLGIVGEIEAPAGGRGGRTRAGTRPRPAPARRQHAPRQPARRRTGRRR